MIEFRTLSDDSPALQLSPLLRAALRTMEYAAAHSAIGYVTPQEVEAKFYENLNADEKAV